MRKAGREAAPNSHKLAPAFRKPHILESSLQLRFGVFCWRAAEGFGRKREHLRKTTNLSLLIHPREIQSSITALHTSQTSTGLRDHLCTDSFPDTRKKSLKKRKVIHISKVTRNISATERLLLREKGRIEEISTQHLGFEKYPNPRMLKQRWVFFQTLKTWIIIFFFKLT